MLENLTRAEYEVLLRHDLASFAAHCFHELNPQTELAMRGSHHNNVQLGQFGRNRSNVWRYPGVNSFARCGEEGNLLALHPTVKPVAMVADAMLDCSARGEIVLDAFLGSGTTVIAAERTGRRGYGLELDPAYVDTIIRRWQTLTGGSARHAVSGRSFDHLVAQAEATDVA